MDEVTCSICKKSFSNRGNMVAHLKIHDDPETRKVKCPQCDKVYLNASHMRVHVRQVHELQESAKPFVCNSFWENAALEAHTRTHTGERPFSCSECSLRFAIKGNLNSHIKTAHMATKAVHACPEPGCSWRFKRPRELKRHLQTHSKSRPNYPCSACEKSYSTKAALHRHEVVVHECRGNEYACTYCAKKYFFPQELAQHVRCHTGERPFKCKECDASFPTNTSLRRHQQQVHDTKAATCTWGACAMIVKNAASLKKHLKIHSGENSAIRCPREKCSKTFSTRDGIWQHTRRAHNRERPHGCTYCSKKFVNAAGLGKHVRTHTGEKPFPCSSCPKKYASTSHLQSHVVSFHLDERCHGCPQCEKRFYSKSELNRHLDTHKADHERKKFPCTVCGKEFCYKRDVERHKATHAAKDNDEWKHSCPFCESKFSSRKCLSRHVRIHTNEKPHACPVCSRGFVSSSDLRSHETRLHSATDSGSN